MGLQEKRENLIMRIDGLLDDLGRIDLRDEGAVTIASELLDRLHERGVGFLQTISEKEAKKFFMKKEEGKMPTRLATLRKQHRLYVLFLTVLRLDIMNHPETYLGNRFLLSKLGDSNFGDLHPRVLEVIGRLWEGGHYRQAILDTYIALVDAVKEKSGRRNLDGTPLMQTVFSANSPILKVSDDEDEQRGFMWLFTGAVMGIRNPKAHRLVAQEDPQRAFEWLSFASVLFRVLDECEVVTHRSRNARHSERSAAE